MKKINNIKAVLVMLVLAITTTSCGDFEPAIFDPTNGQTFVNFGESETLIISVAGTPDELDQEIPVEISTISNVDRTIRVGVATDSEFLTANPNQYILSETVTIPAGEFTGILNVSAVFANLTNQEVALVIEIVSVDGDPEASVSSGTHTVRMRRIG